MNISLASFGVMGYIILGLAIVSFISICLSFFLSWKWQYADAYTPHTHKGMKRMLVYDSPIYMYVITFFMAILVSIIGAFLLVGAFEGILWLLCWILKILAIIIIVLAWIAIVGGILCIFEEPIYGILIAAVGFLLKAGGNWLKEAMKNAVVWCQDLLHQVWGMSTKVALFGYENWQTILMIIAVPVIMTLAIAALIILVDLICMGMEDIVTAMYKVHRKCPYCGNDKGFTYIINGIEHPVKLHPSMYGIFFHRNPDGKRIPTMLLNGRGKLTRFCPICEHLISNDGPHTYGTDIHIGIVGAPAAGKSFLVYSVLDSLQNKYKPSLTQVDQEDKTDIAQLADRIHSGEQIQTAPSDRYHAVQLMYKPSGRPIPYHLYFYDVAGEAFNQELSEDTRKKALQFYDNVKSIMLVVDPFRFDTNAAGCRFSHKFQQWASKYVLEKEEYYSPNDIYIPIRDFLIQSGRKLKEIDFNIVLTKADMGYLEALGVSRDADQATLRRVVDQDLGMSNIMIDIEGKFKTSNIIEENGKKIKTVNFYAVSVIDNSDSAEKMFVDILNRQGVKEMELNN